MIDDVSGVYRSLGGVYQRWETVDVFDTAFEIANIRRSSRVKEG